MKRITVIIVLFVAGCEGTSPNGSFPNGSFVYLRSSCQKYLVTDNYVYIGTIGVQEKSGTAHRLSTTDLVTAKEDCANWESSRDKP